MIRAPIGQGQSLDILSSRLEPYGFFFLSHSLSSLVISRHSVRICINPHVVEYLSLVLFVLLYVLAGALRPVCVKGSRNERG